jgi:4-hydroxyphenylpyruvate dioxygenase-like putative hemolysin
MTNQSGQKSAPVKVSRIIHTIHAVEDIDAARHLYQDSFGAVVFSEGYEPFADRDMALAYVTNHMIEPMAPRNPADESKSFARYLKRYGQGWHSFELKVESAADAAAKLEAAGCTLIKAPYPVFFFVKAESTGGVLLEVCEVPMRNDPYDRPNWNPRWGEVLACGLLKLDHIACVVHEIEKPLHFFTQLVDGEILSDDHIEVPQAGRRLLIRVGDTNIAFIAPDDANAGPLGAYLSQVNSGIYALVWQVEDEARAIADFEAKGLGVVRSDCVGGGFAIDPANFYDARHEFRV